MNGGHACRTIEDTESAGFHADVHGLYAALGHPSEPPPSSGRSEVDTQPYADAYADTLASPPAPAALAEEEPSWCIDTGSLMLTMKTLDLWESLERGDVLAWMRVWREGMECWTPVGEIPELACAIAGTPEPPAGPDVDGQSGSPEGQDPRGDVTHTPAPMSADTADPPPASTIRPVVPGATPQRRGARWLALGSAVAIAAVLSAIFVHQRSAAPPPVTLAGAAAATEHAAAVEQSDRAEHAEMVIRALPPGPDDEVPAPEVATRHDERGQHRQPRGGRRAAYGR